MTRETLADLAIWIGFSTGLLTLIDWLLLDKQKDWIPRKLEDGWLWLAERRFDALARVIQSRWTQHLIAAFAVLWLGSSLIGVIRYGLNAPQEFSRAFP
jgi:hypothetical protein